MLFEAASLCNLLWKFYQPNTMFIINIGLKTFSEVIKGGNIEQRDRN